MYKWYTQHNIVWSVFILNVIYGLCCNEAYNTVRQINTAHFSEHHAECRYAVCLNAECHGAEKEVVSRLTFSLCQP
jgi:hypothetical protein